MSGFDLALLCWFAALMTLEVWCLVVVWRKGTRAGQRGKWDL